MSCVAGLFFITALVAFILYQWFYLACPDEFNELGRCFSTDGMIVYDADSFVWLPIGVISMVVAIAFGFFSKVTKNG